VGSIARSFFGSIVDPTVEIVFKLPRIGVAESYQSPSGHRRPWEWSFQWSWRSTRQR